MPYAGIKKEAEMKITLQKYKLSDLNRHLDLLNGNGIHALKTKEKKWLEKAINNYKKNKPEFYVLAINLNKKAIGNVIAEKIKLGESLHLGYWIGKEYWGKGYTTKAVKLFLKEVNKKFKPKKIIASYSKKNPASGRVLRKCRFKKKGVYGEGMKKLNVKGSNFETSLGSSKFVKLKLNGKEETPALSVIMNTFGISQDDRLSKKVYCEIAEKKDCLLFNAKSSDIECPKWICGIPTARIGKSIWGQDSGLKLGNVGDYSKMKISTKWQFNVKKGFSEFIYDIWLTENAAGPLTMNGIEMMIVLDTNFDMPWKDLGKFGSFEVKYNLKQSEIDRGHTFAFLLKKKAKSFEFELLDFIDYCMKHLKKKQDYYIRSIDFGPEFTKNTEVELKIKQIVFDFKKSLK